MIAVAASRPRGSASPLLLPLLSTAIPVPLVAPELLPLLLAIWAVLLGASWIVGRMNLAAIECESELPASAFAWEAVPAQIQLFNLSQSWAARDILVSHTLSKDRMRRPRAYRPRIPVGGEIEMQPLVRVPRRGRHHEYLVRVSSAFPFGLIRWHRDFRFETDLLGLPRLGELRQTDRILPDETHPDLRRPRGTWRPGEFYALQEWRPGIPQRQIAWKASARRGEILVRQNQVAKRPPAHVILHLGVGQRGSRADFERAVSLTATVVEHLLRRRQPLRVSLIGASVRSWRPRSGRDGLNQVLIALAEVSAEADALKQIPYGLLNDGATVLMHTGGLEPPPLSGPSTRVLDARAMRKLRAYFREARAMPARTRLPRSA
jgi:uncharacterized protein (DUF58 family)